MKRLQKSSAKRSLNKKVETSGTSESTPKRAKANNDLWYAIPEVPEGMTEDVLKDKISQLKKICKSPRPDPSTLQTLMDATFPLRRREILEGTEDLNSLLKQYPPLQKAENVSGNISAHEPLCGL